METGHLFPIGEVGVVGRDGGGNNRLTLSDLSYMVKEQKIRQQLSSMLREKTFCKTEGLSKVSPAFMKIIHSPEARCVALFMAS